MFPARLVAILFILCIALPHSGNAQTHEYHFNSNLNEATAGPTLVENLSCGATAGLFYPDTTLVNGTSSCSSFNAFNFSAGGGLGYPNSNVINGSYTINLYFKFNSSVVWARILDFTNLSSDNGLYMSSAGYLYYWTGNGATNTQLAYFFAGANCYSLLTVVRDGATKQVSIYVNGALTNTFTDGADLLKPATSTTPIYFFRDQDVGGITFCEVQAGGVAYISVSPNIATAGSIASTYANIPSLVQSGNPFATGLISPANPQINCITPAVTLSVNVAGTYQWSNGTFNSTVTGITTPSNYSVTLTTNNCCSASGSVNVTQSINPPTASVSPTSATLTCLSPSTTLTASGGGTYNWGGGITTATKTVSSANTYTVTVTAADGCTATASAIISANTTPPTALISPSSVTLNCTTSSAILTASGGGTYNWGGGITTATNTINSPNTYTVTVTAANGCTATASSVVSQNTTPPVAAVNPTSAALNCSVLSSTLTASGGGTYNWGGGITTAANVVNTPNTYTVTVTGANGCTATASSIVSQNITPPTATVNPSSATLNCTVLSATLTAGGGGTYNWGGGITTAANTVNSPNTYTVTVTAANGCTATASAVVSQSVAAPTATITPSSATLTCASPTATLTASGGVSYNWGGGIITATNTVNSPNTYTVTVTAANGCTATASVIVSQNIAAPTATITPSSATITCASPSILLTASGGGTYNWGGGITTAANTVNSANTYTVTVTAANGCTATASATVSQNTTPPIASVTPSSSVINCTTSTSSLTASGGGTYNWGGGITTTTNTVNAPNTYTVTVTAANGCTATASALVTQSITPPVASVSPTSATLNCTVLSAALTASGGGTYNWGGGITTATNTVNTPNTYTVTVTAANGCTATASAIISQSIAAPTATITPSSATLTCASPTATLTASGGVSYNWGGGIITATNTVNSPNTYTVTVTAANGCTATASAIISQTVAPPVASITPASATLTCTTLSAVLTASGGGTYNWGGGITTAANTVNSANTYTVTVTAANGCTATASATVSQNTTPPVATVTPGTSTLTCATPSVTLTASGGTSYDWGGGIITATNTVNTAGNYTVTATDVNGCTASVLAVVNQNNTVPVASVTPASFTLTCTTVSTILTASGGATYDWGGGITTATNTVNAPNTYTVTVTGANGCTATASATVNQTVTPPVATVTPTLANLTCASPTALLTAGGGGTYNWGGGITTATNTVNTPNTYTVTVTGANGCTATASATVNQTVTPPVATVTPASANLTCASPTALLTAGGGGTYDWGGGNNTTTNTVNAAGTYTVTVTDVNGCTASASSVVSQTTTPPVAAINPSSATLTCTTLSTTLTASGGVSYDWGGGIVTAANAVNTANTYSVTVTDANGCTASTSAVVNQNTTPPTATVTPSSFILDCISTTTTLTASGGASYDWGGGIITTTNTVNSPNTYTVTVTAANGCTATASSTVTQSIVLPLAAISPATFTLTCTTPSTILTASGGASYDWGGGITTATNTVNAPNTYSVTVTGANGCTATASATVNQTVTPPVATVTPASANLTCASPTALLTAGGGGTYDWGGGNNTTTNIVNAAGTYTVTVTDANGCTATASSVVSQTTTPPVAAINPSSATLTCTVLSATLTASGGVSYDWGGGIVTAANAVNTANTYSVTVTDANGCTASTSAVVNQNTTPPAAVINPANATLTCTTTTITLTAGGGTSYDWGGGIITTTNTVNSPNTYTVTVTAANGCTATASSSINQTINPPPASISPANTTITCATPNATLTASGGTSYNWGSGIITATNIVSSPNTYTVTVTDNNGCSATASSIVAQDTAQPNASVSVGATLTCATLNSTLTASSTTANAGFNWGGGNTTTSKTVTIPGSYTVTVTDPANGCTATSSGSVIQDITAPNITLNNTGILSCANASVTINAASTTANVSYDWGGGNTTNSNSVSAAATYTITVTDPANGCTSTASNSVQQNITPPPVSIATPATLNCINSTVTLTASSTVNNATFDWGGGIITSTNTVSAPATYGVTATDPVNGCTASVTANVNQNLTLPGVTIAPPGTITCHTPSVTLSASSTAVIPVYNWGGGNTASTYTVSVIGTYPVTVTDNDNGCSASASATVADVPLMVPSETHTNATCFSFNDGSIDLTITGGQTPLTYLWSNAAVTEDINGLVAGNYSVVVTDGINCTVTLSVPITEPANILVTETHTDVTCNGFNNGTINVTVSGGTPPYSYRWNDADINEDRTGLAPGTYDVTVTYNNSCTTSISAPITEPASLTIQPVVTNPTCATLGNDGNISVTATGGTTPFSFVWNDGTATNNYPNAGEGNYSLTVTDANGCSVTDAYVLAYQYDFVVDATPFVTIDLGASTTLSYTLTGTTGNYTSKWLTAYGLSCTDCVSPEASPTYSNLYHITIENEFGCISSDTVTVRVLPKYDVFVPNVFTPNNDGNNDVFGIFGNLDGVEFLQIQIFNRIGEKVYESYDHQFTWDGTYKGVLQNAQVFTWQLKLTWLNGHKDEIRKGTLTLLK